MNSWMTDWPHHAVNPVFFLVEVANRELIGGELNDQ